mmetsp:Transcript_43206/g.49678  ORF Transcript_43206/g.49678 Transcript_43206/m.49678 type:complete len:865 (+) Transcript_43206:48-2642(+)
MDTMEDFFKYIVEDNVEKINEILPEEEGDMDFYMASTDGEGLPPMHMAALFASPKVLEILIKKGSPDVNQRYQDNPIIHLSLELSCMEAFKQRSLDTFKMLLLQDDIDFNQIDRTGLNLLHKICILGHAQFIPALHEKGVNCEARCFADYLPIHYAVANRNYDCVKALLEVYGSEMITAQDPTGDSVVHIAIRRGAWKSLLTLLQVGGEEVLSKENIRGVTPLALAQNCGFEEEFNQVVQTLESGNELTVQTQPYYKGQTLLIVHDSSMDHTPLPDDSRAKYKQRSMQPENCDRLRVLIHPPFGILLGEYFDKNALWVNDFPAANMADILRIHDYYYVNKIKAACERASGLQNLDRDTFYSKGTYQAALYAAGSVVTAVDQIMMGFCRNVFCAIRPPGHHAGPYGDVEAEESPESTSNGFCFFNNIAIGAAYAKYMYRNNGINNIAIVDFDVHHGNGTEAVVRNLKPQEVYHNIKLPFCDGKIKNLSYKPWLSEDDSSSVLFISVHAFDHDNLGFYPGSGGQRKTDLLSASDSEDKEANETQDPDYPGGVVNCPMPFGSTSADWRAEMRSKVFPRLLKFRPDMIFISAGFDGHTTDSINAGFMNLVEADYRWITEELTKIANTCCSGRIISALEGGYRIKGSICSPLAKSVAAHVQGLMDATNESYQEMSELEMEQEKGRNEDLMMRVREIQEQRGGRKRRRAAGANPLIELLKSGNDEALRELVEGALQKSEDDDEDDEDFEVESGQSGSSSSDKKQGEADEAHNNLMARIKSIQESGEDPSLVLKDPIGEGLNNIVYQITGDPSDGEEQNPSQRHDEDEGDHNDEVEHSSSPKDKIEQDPTSMLGGDHESPMETGDNHPHLD